MSSLKYQELAIIDSLYKKCPQALSYYRYGTAGFRYEIKHLEFIFFRSTIAAILKAKYIKKPIGIMITASHNTIEYNGLKIVDCNGEMLDSEWESNISEIVNTCNLFESIEHIINKYSIDIESESTLIIGHDTRPSCSTLIKTIEDASNFMNNRLIIHGLLTTPQLHFIVKCTNDSSYGIPNENGYYRKIVQAFLNFNQNNKNGVLFDKLHVDCANGVGSIKFKLLVDYFNKIESESNQIHTILNNCLIYHNDHFQEHNLLNLDCGADYIRSFQKLPISFQANHPFVGLSIDGDADRIIFFNAENANKLTIIDGDYIASLMALFVKKYTDAFPKYFQNISIGVVGTAYSNGSYVNFIRENMNLEFVVVPTGVKYLHKKASEYDIGIYFESNGHGNILFSDNFNNALNSIIISREENNNSLSLNAVSKLKNFVEMINQSVGDSLSIFLAVYSILLDFEWNIEKWSNIFVKRESSLSKIHVDPSLLKMSSCETIVIEPRGLQTIIDDVISSIPNARGFLRPSGTESIIRLYVESNSKIDCQRISDQIIQKVDSFFQLSHKI